MLLIQRWLFTVVVVWLTILTGGCAVPPAPTTGNASERGAPTAPKRLVIGILQEPPGWTPWTTIGTVGGAQQVIPLARRTLTILGDQGDVLPELAVSVPSLEAGDWRVNPDGTMEQTWQINPAARWQDGDPVTADDFVFGWQLLVRPDLPASPTSTTSLIDSVIAPSPQILVIRFNASSILGGQALFDPQPRHLLGPIFDAGDPDRLVNSDYWTTGYIGAGPYRPTNWQLGTSLELSAFQGYVHGKPRIDTIVVKFLNDPNTLLAGILSGDIEVALPDGVSIEQAADLKSTWAGPGTGNSVVIFVDGSLVFVAWQERPEYARPASAHDPRVRRAFGYSIDKEGINEVGNAGLGRLADSWITPDDPRRPQFADSIPDWAHDIGIARRTLEDAGWRRGSDGVYVSATGESMATEIRVPPGAGYQKILSILGDGWRSVGADVTEHQITAAQQGDREYISTHPFADALGRPYREVEWQDSLYSCASAARAETKWAGHRDGYCNPAADQLIRRLIVTVDQAALTDLEIQLMRVVLKDDYAAAPLYWRVSPVVVAKGISGPGQLQFGLYGRTLNTWNVHLWDRS